jgi:hypothetical protein
VVVEYDGSEESEPRPCPLRCVEPFSYLWRTTSIRFVLTWSPAWRRHVARLPSAHGDVLRHKASTIPSPTCI